MSDRLEQIRRRNRQSVVHGDAPGRPESEFRAIDRVEGAVGQRHRDVDHAAAERTFLHRIAHAVLDGRNPLFGNDPAGNPVFEYEALTTRQRAQFDDDVAVLAMAARLLLVPPALGSALAHRLADGEGRLTGFHREAITALQPFERQVDVLLVDAAQQRLMRIVERLPRQTGVFLEQLVERGGEPHLVLVVLDRDGDRVIRLASFPMIARGGRRADAEAVTGLDLIRLGDADDITGPGLLEALRGAALQREQRAGTLSLPRCGRQLGTFRQRRPEHAADGEAADRRFIADLENLDHGSVDTEPLGGLGGRGGIVA